MDRKELLKEFYVKKNYVNLKNILQTTSFDSEKEILARIYLEEKNYDKAAQLYKSLDMIYEYGRCELLKGNFDYAKDLWNSIKIDSPPVLWGKSLLEFINLYVIHIPTFFQIRAFLEVDFDALLNAKMINYCETLQMGRIYLHKIIRKVINLSEEFLLTTDTMT